MSRLKPTHFLLAEKIVDITAKANEIKAETDTIKKSSDELNNIVAGFTI